MPQSVIVKESFNVVGIGPLTVGQTYSLDDSLAAMMVTAGKATYVAAPTRNDWNTPGRVVVATAAQVAALKAADTPLAAGTVAIDPISQGPIGIIDATGGLGGAEFIASAPTFESIQAAVDAASVAGGGVVRLLAKDYDIGANSVQMRSRVRIEGVPPTITGSSYAPETGAPVFSGGTRLLLSGNNYAFIYNSTDLGSPIANFASDGLYFAGVKNVLVVGGGGPIKVGAVNASGAYFCEFDNIFASDPTAEWALDFQNFQYCRFGSFVVRNTVTTVSGGIRYRASVASTTVLNGDSIFFGRTFIWFGSLNGRGIRMSAKGSAQLNDMNGQGAVWQVNGYTSASVALSTAATVSGSKDITLSGGDLANWNLIQLGKPIYFTGSTPNFLESGALFFIVVKDDNAKTFQISTSHTSTTGQTITATGTFAMRVGAFPSAEFIAEDASSLLTKGVTPVLNAEAVGSIVPIYAYRMRQYRIDATSQGLFAAQFLEVFSRDSDQSTVELQTTSFIGTSNHARVYSVQGDMAPLIDRNKPRTAAGSVTLDNGHNGATLTVTSGSAATVTIPAMLPAGFKCRIVQGGAGKVTIAKGVSSLGFSSLNNFLSTSGQYAAIDIERTGVVADGFHFTNDDAAFLITGDLAA